ncbi:MAG: Fibronectin type domain protein, partial [Verrucomicrobiales bacterium]|nr:Fibronectin type domain protein [Verrucomicrobiales bacterium]
CAPGQETSFSAPYVSGGATILLQAAARGDAGTNVAGASDIRTVKALLMNGAVKPSNWTHTASMPVDATHGTGAGVLNIFNSYKQMTFGQRRLIETTTVGTGAAHPPGSNQGNESSMVGWDFSTITTLPVQDSVAHYYFNLPATDGTYTLTATLVWNRPLSSTSINDLDLFLYRTSDGAQIALSTSRVDNVEHIYIPSLPAGRYDLQVLKNSGTKSISNTETYALAFESFVIPLSISNQSGTVGITWPLYPNGFTLESTPSLSPPIAWTPITSGVVISNNSYRLSVNSPSGMSYYRLRR